MSTYIKLSKAQLSKIIQSGRFLHSKINKLGKETLMEFSVSLPKDTLSPLATTDNFVGNR